MYNHNKAQQSKNRVHISWDILHKETAEFFFNSLAFDNDKFTSFDNSNV